LQLAGRRPRLIGDQENTFMPTTLEKPTTMKCACPGCHCVVHPETPFRAGDKLFCSDACAKGHPNGESCHAGCGCECAG
jgi:hypothetical protein